MTSIQISTYSSCNSVTEHYNILIDSKNKDKIHFLHLNYIITGMINTHRTWTACQPLATQCGGYCEYSKESAHSALDCHCHVLSLYYNIPSGSSMANTYCFQSLELFHLYSTRCKDGYLFP